MLTQLRDLAANSVSYISNQVSTTVTPLRIRRNGRSPEEVCEEIKHELEITLRREKDVEREIRNEELRRNKCQVARQELNFRIQTIDNNRTALVKRMGDYEINLSKIVNTQKKYIDRYNDSQSRYERAEMKLRSCGLDLQSCDEMKQNALNKIPQLTHQFEEKNSALRDVQAAHDQLRTIISNMREKRDILVSTLEAANQSHALLLREHVGDASPSPPSATHRKQSRKRSSSKEDSVFVQERKNSAAFNSQDSVTSNDEEQEYRDKVAQAIDHIQNVSESLSLCEQQLTFKEAEVGQIYVQKSNLEKEVGRLQEMVSLQSDLLDRIDRNRDTLRGEQEAALLEKQEIEGLMTELESATEQTRNKMQEVKNDIEAVNEALNTLSRKKHELAKKLKKLIAEEKEIFNNLKIFEKNRLSLRARFAQLTQDQIELEQSDNVSQIKKFRSETARVYRLDTTCALPVRGTLTLARDGLTFLPSESRAKTLYSCQHEILDVSHSHFNRHEKTLILRVYLRDTIAYQGNHDDQNDQRVSSGPKTHSSSSKRLSKRHNSGGPPPVSSVTQPDESFVDWGYRFQIKDPSEVNRIQLMHNFLRSWEITHSQADAERRLHLLDGSAEKQRRNTRNLERQKKREEVETKAREEMHRDLDGAIVRSNDSELNLDQYIDGEPEERDDDDLDADYEFVPTYSTRSLLPVEVDFRHVSKILKQRFLTEIVYKCPPRTHIWQWEMRYNSTRDGISINTFYDLCGPAARGNDPTDHDESVIIVRDRAHHVFGAFVDGPWVNEGDYRGTVDSFVFKFDIHDKMHVFRSAGAKNWFLRSDLDSITIGAGECPAIYIDGDLNFGRTGNSETFGSPPLTTDTQFQVEELEVWAPMTI